MRNLFLFALMGFVMPALALAGGAGNLSLYNTQTSATCSGVFDVDTLQTSRLAGVTTVEMWHISNLTRAQQQELAAKKGSGSLEAEFHRGSDNCWYMLLKTMSSGKVRTQSSATNNTAATTSTVTRNTGSFATYLQGQSQLSENRTSSSTVARSQVSTVFRTVTDINFSLYDVMILTEAPVEPMMTIVYANMTDAQKASLRAFYGPRAEGATVYRGSDWNWYIMF